MAETTCMAALSFDQALSQLITGVEQLGTEKLPLGRAGRRRLARQVTAERDSPSFDAAAMDGYAVRLSEIEAGNRRFSVCGANFAGHECAEAIPEQSSVSITTGAKMPKDLDCVVPWETVEVDGSSIKLSANIGKRHVRGRGSDFQKGDVLLPQGQIIEPRSLLVAAAADVRELTVWRRPRTAVLANGSELRKPGTSRNIDYVPDALTEALLLFARQWGGKPVGSRLVPDDETAINNAAKALLSDCDILVVAGGASQGLRDLARSSLFRLGLTMHFSDVAIKPGKPVWYGRLAKKHVIGLPGNPTAAMTCARLFLAPLIVTLSGGEPGSALTFEKLQLTTVDCPVSDREQFLCATRQGDRATLIERQSASMQSTLAYANALVRIRPGEKRGQHTDLFETLRF